MEDAVPQLKYFLRKVDLLVNQHICSIALLKKEW